MIMGFLVSPAISMLMHDCARLYSTRIVGTDTRMSRLDIRVSKVIPESGKTETAENSRLCVAFRMFFWKFCRPIG